MKVTMWWGDDSWMAKLGITECNSPPPTSNSLGSYYLIILWRYVNVSMCPINIYFALPTFFYYKNETINDAPPSSLCDPKRVQRVGFAKLVRNLLPLPASSTKRGRGVVLEASGLD
jgi:hypothetical protein